MSSLKTVLPPELFILPSLSSSQRQRFALYWCVAFGGALLWNWHWQICVATGSGAGLLWFLWWNDQRPLSLEAQLEQQLKMILPRSPSQRRLWFRTVMAGMTVVGSYGLLNLMTTVDNPALWGAIAIQGAMIWGLGGVLFRKGFRQSPAIAITQVDQWLEHLVEEDALKRFVAVRKLGQLLQQQQLSPSDRHQVIQSLILLWKQETEDPVRERVLQVLGAIAPEERQPLPPRQKPSTPAPPLAIPLELHNHFPLQRQPHPLYDEQL